jgi:hypothetical protein
MNVTDERLEARLRVAESPIADDGFSVAILTRLPRKRLRARTARCLSLGIAAAIGGLITLLGASPEILSPEILSLGILPPVLGEPGAIAASLLISLPVIALLFVPFAWLVYSETAARGSP